MPRFNNHVPLIVCWLIICIAATICLADEAQPHEASARGRFQLPKIFEFDTYKRLYSKNYATLSEELSRKRIVLARAFQVFIEAVRYRHRLSTKYLALNELSDLTVGERKRLYNEGSKSDVGVHSMGQEVAANLEDIEEKFAEIVDHKRESAEYAEIAAQIEASQTSPRARRKRDLSERQLSMDDLMRDPGVQVNRGQISPKFSPRTGSNNPNYAQPEQLSEGLDDDNDVPANNLLTPGELLSIAAQKGSAILSDALSKYVPTFGSLSSSADDGSAANQREPLPDEVFLDYRTTGCLLMPKSQGGRCGACYIFATMSLYEFHHCRQTGKLVPFSEQYPLDCGKRLGLKGCTGGLVHDSTRFVETFGLEQTVDYPYRQQEQVCGYEPNANHLIMGHTRVERQSKGVLKFWDLRKGRLAQLLEEHGPMYFSVSVDEDFAQYGGGVDMPRDCSNGSGHAMVLIGHGREDGLEYWLLRNSHGPTWGIDGHYKLSKEVKLSCLNTVAYVDAKFLRNTNHKGMSAKRKQALLQMFKQR